MRSAIVVSSSEAQTTRKLLEVHGVWDKTRRLQKCADNRVAVPVKTTDARLLATCLHKDRDDVCVIEIDLPPAKRELLQTPAQHLVQMSSQLLEQKDHLMPAERETLMCEVPDHWEKHGDLILLPVFAYTSPAWDSFGQGLWQAVADCLGGKRVARKAPIKTDGFRSSQVTLLLGDSGLVQHIDNGIRYEYDVTKCMFSAGNVTEKLRIAGFKCEGETVVDLYAGIGYFTLPYLVHAKAEHVHACEWNPDAVAALTRNLELNGVRHCCTVHPGDNRKLSLCGIADRVNLGLIPSSEEGWPVACRVLKPTGGILHLHGNVNRCTGDGEILRSDEVTVASGTSFVGDSNSVISRPNSTNARRNNGKTSSGVHKSGEVITDDPLEHPQANTVNGCADKTKALSSRSSSHLCMRNTFYTEGNSQKAVETITYPKTHPWMLWADRVCNCLCLLLEKEHGGHWRTVVQHIEYVKSYAPHVDHIVLDIQCTPFVAT